jgi:GMP reductase
MLMVFIIEEKKLDFKDVLIVPKKSNIKSRKEVNLEREFKFKHSPLSWKGVPIMVANMDTTGTFELAIEASKHNIITCIHKHYTLDEWKEFINNNPDTLKNVGVSFGVSEYDLDRLDTILSMDSNLNILCLDVANGYTDLLLETVKKVRSFYPEKILIAGNIVTPDYVEALCNAGADIIKAGIGGGSVCTTRLKTGVGYPQFSCALECSAKAKELGCHLISDGGITNSGDLSKAFIAGADFVMIGGLFAGHIESAGDIIEKDGKTFKKFYGMASAVAMNKYTGNKDYKTAEGKVILMELKGPVNDTILALLGGVRSTCSYIGVRDILDISENTQMVKVNNISNEIYGKN